MENFLSIPEDRIIYHDEYFFLVRDIYPVSPGHTLIISKNLKKDYFDLSQDEKQNLDKAIEKAKMLIELEYTPDGYNIGMNCGAAAGQTVFQFHCHLIPRFNGDMKNPSGGVRHCIENKGYY